MRINEKIIKETLLKGERVTLECKKAKAEVPKSIWQTYSAFANTIDKNGYWEVLLDIKIVD